MQEKSEKCRIFVYFLCFLPALASDTTPRLLRDYSDNPLLVMLGNDHVKTT